MGSFFIRVACLVLEESLKGIGRFLVGSKSRFSLISQFFLTKSITIFAMAGEEVRPGDSIPIKLIKFSRSSWIIKSLDPFSSGGVIFDLTAEKE